MDAYKKLYDDIADRKGEQYDVNGYTGGNGRIDRAVKIIPELEIRFNKKFNSVVDVGGATGNLGYALKDICKKRYTVDISSACEIPAQCKGNEFVLSNVDVEGIKLSDESCDLVVALDFIEHILNPEFFAEECYRILKFGGVVLINTPNIQFWKHLESLIVHGKFPHTSGDKEVYHGGHVAFYNFNDMKTIFSSVGFTNCNMETMFLDPIAPPPLWTSISSVDKKQLLYGDLIFTCQK